MREEEKRFLEFLDEYDRLCRKYNIMLDSCGHCNSPWLTITNKYGIEKHISHLRGEMKLNGRREEK